ncbi:hypothetical protein ABIE62_002786 [Porphyrobacter sp. MBR-155]|jgi:hypothetical protein
MMAQAQSHATLETLAKLRQLRKQSMRLTQGGQPNSLQICSLYVLWSASP